MFYFKTYIAYVDKVQRFKNKYVQNGYRHFLGKVQVFYKNSQLRIARLELQYFLSQQWELFMFTTCTMHNRGRCLSYVKLYLS
jgi:hypothetical protein